MLRGIEKRRIFLDDLDRRDFLARLAGVLARTQTICLAWALLPNHVHLVLRTKAEPLAGLMASLNTGYALYFNRRHHRVGHLFQNRFRSRIVLDDADLLGVVLYVSGNPLKHGIVESLEQLEHFPWCSYGALMGSSEPRSFHHAADALGLFERSPRRARAEVKRWMTERWDLTVTLAGAASSPGPAGLCADLTRIIESVCRELDVAPCDLASGSRTSDASAARAMITQIATNKGWSLVALAPHLGVSVPALSQARRRGKDLLAERTGFLTS